MHGGIISALMQTLMDSTVKHQLVKWNGQDSVAPSQKQKWKREKTKQLTNEHYYIMYSRLAQVTWPVCSNRHFSFCENIIIVSGTKLILLVLLTISYWLLIIGY